MRHVMYHEKRKRECTLNVGKLKVAEQHFQAEESLSFTHLQQTEHSNFLQYMQACTVSL